MIAEHQIVVLRRRHGFDIGAEHPPEGGKLVDGGGIGARGWRENAPAADEEFGETGIGSGMLGSGDRMRRHEMHAGRQVRSHVAHDGGLDRTDIGDDCAALKLRGNLFGDFTTDADRRADDDEIGARGSGAVALDHLVGQTELGDAPACLPPFARWR